MNEKPRSIKFLTAAFAVPAVALISQLGLSETSHAASFKIACDTEGQIPTIIADFTGMGDKPEARLLSFLPEYFSEEDAGVRCRDTASTLQNLYTASEMHYLASDTVDNRPVVCAVERRGVGCDSYSAEVLFFLEPQVNPAVALYNMLGEDFKQSHLPEDRTVSRIYTELTPIWWPF